MNYFDLISEITKKTPPTKRPHGGSEDDEDEEEEEEEETQATGESERQPAKRTRRKTQLEGSHPAAKSSFPILTSDKYV